MKKNIKKRSVKITMIITLIIIIAFAGVFGFMKQPQFGEIPSGKRLVRIMASPNYKSGSFQNQKLVPVMTEGVSYLTVLKEFLFGKSSRNTPADNIPAKKTDLLNLDPGKNTMVWFGHSSYFLQLEGKTILVDPVLSGSASPVKFTTMSYKGSDNYSVDDLPDIDYLFITHDHWDHLDYETVMKLRSKVRKVITGLGTGAHLERWGYSPENIIELDWNETAQLDNGFTATATPAQHFSGRGVKRNLALWVSFVLKTPAMQVYFGGDSGYGPHYAEIGNTYGPFDLVFLECGQYNERWKYIHMKPEEVVQASQDLKAKILMPVHWAKFSLSLHAWDEPIKRVTDESKRKNIHIIHPMIGEEVNLKEPVVNEAWW
ncbi:MAG: MBL fold metallo-hydrolase [Methanococcaceae archaeon]